MDNATETIRALRAENAKLRAAIGSATGFEIVLPAAKSALGALAEISRLRAALAEIRAEASQDSEVWRQAHAALGGGSVRGPLPPLVRIGQGGTETAITPDERGQLHEGAYSDLASGHDSDREWALIDKPEPKDHEPR
jgi:hypothetical protein